MYKKGIFSALVILLLVSTASAHDWDAGGGANRSWTNAANWTSDILPTINDSTKLYTVTDETNGPLVDTTGATSSYVRVGGPGGAFLTDWCTLSIVDGGVLDVNEWIMAGTDSGTGGGRSGVLNMEGGILNLGVNNPTRGNLNIAHSYAARGFLYMTGGVINAPGAFFIAKNNTTVGEVHLDGGVIYSGDFWMATGTVGCSASMDITAGTLILEGNDTPTISGYIANGWLTGYGNEDDIMYDYNVTNTGKTTVWAVPEPATICLFGLGALGLIRRRK